MWFGSDIWLRRTALSVYTAVATSSKDVTWVIPEFWDSFWNAIDENGEELRLVYPWGVEADWKVTNHTGSGSFSKTNRHGAIHARALDLPNVADSISNFLLYYKSASTQGPSGNVVSFTPSSPLTGDICLGGPGQYQAEYIPPVLRQRKPLDTWTKRSGDVLRFGVSFDANFARASRESLYGGSLFETPKYATLSAVDTAGGAASLLAANQTYWHWDGQRFWLISAVQSGTDQTNYTLLPKCYTCVPPSSDNVQEFAATIGLRVEDARHEV